MEILRGPLSRLTPSVLWKGLACVISSLALTVYIDLFTLDSIWTRLLFFVCVLAACGIFTYGAGRLFKPAPPVKMVLEAVIAAALTLAVSQNILFPYTAREVLISLISKTAGEICFCDLIIDGVSTPVADGDVVENSGWLYRGEYDNFMIWPEEDGVDNCLTMRFFAEEVHVGFPYTPYAGSVTIQSSTGFKKTLDLRCPEWEEGEEVQYTDVPIDCRSIAPLPRRIGCNAGFLLILSALFLTARYAAGLAWGEISKAAPDAGREPEPAASGGRQNQRFAPKRDYSSLPVWLAAVLAAGLFVILYWRNATLYQINTDLYDVYISVFPTADGDGNMLDLSAFKLHTSEDHSYNPILDCNIQILPEGETPNPRLDLDRKNATIRVRGNSSRGALYKNYKIHLDKGTETFYGQEVLNINKNYGTHDVTRMATKLSTDLLRGIEHVTDYRSYFMRLWVRDASLPQEDQEFVYQGLYVELEQPNKTYFKTRKLAEPAALYKARNFSFYPNEALLEVDDPAYSREAFEKVLGIREGGGSHQKLLEMLDAVNDSSRNFEEVFAQYFDEDNYLTWLAFNLLMGNTDVVSQNYLLYNPENSETWYFIHWDFDGGLALEKPAHDLPASLKGIQRLMASRLHRRYFQEVPGSLEKLDAKMQELLNTHITRERVTALTKKYKSVLRKTSALGPSPDFQRRPLDQWLGHIDSLYSKILRNYDEFKASSRYPLSGYMAAPVRNPDGSLQFAWDPFCSLTAPPVSYTLRIYSDSAMQDLVYEITGLQDTRFQLENGLPNGTYYMWVSGTDAEGREQVSLEHVSGQSGEVIYGLREFTLE